MIQPIPTVAPRKRASIWLWVLAAMFALSVLIVASGLSWISHLDGTPIHLVIDGDDLGGFDPGVLNGWDMAGIAFGAVIAVFAVLLIVPVVLLICLAASLVGVVLGIALPLIALVLVLALVLSPLWLLAALVWLLVRRAAPAVAHAA